MDNKPLGRMDIPQKDRTLLIAILFILPILAFKDLDNDTWFLLNCGRYVLANGIPHIEPFTIHEGFSFVMQQWLSAVTFWSIYDLLGAFGVKLLVMLLAGLNIFVFYKLVMRVTEGFFLISCAVSYVTSILIVFWTVARPGAFSMLILTLELYLLESYISTKKPIYLVGLPILSVLMINMHAAMWPMMLVFLGPYLIDGFSFKIKKIQSAGYGVKLLLLSMVLVFLAGFINPYGWEAMTYLFRSYGHVEISTLVSEMKPATITTFVGAIVIITILINLFTYIFYRKGKTTLRYVLLGLGTAYMALSSLRSYTFLLICGFFPLAYYLKNISIKVEQKPATPKQQRLRIVLVIAIIFALFFGVANSAIQAKKGDKDMIALQEACEYLKSQQTDDMVLYAGYNEGGMVEFYELSPYIDARAEVFVIENNKKEDVMEEYRQVQLGLAYYRDFLEKYQFTHLLLSTFDDLYMDVLHDRDYELAFENEYYYVFELKD